MVHPRPGHANQASDGGQDAWNLKQTHLEIEPELTWQMQCGALITG